MTAYQFSQDEIILILSVALCFCLLVILLLWRALSREIKKRVTPSLTFEFDPHDLGLYLKNDGSCGIRDIRIGEIDLNVEAGFTKVLRMSFEPVDMLMPGKSMRLKYRLFDKGQEIPPSVSKQVSAYLSAGTFAGPIFCKNADGIRFELSVVKRKEGFFLMNVKPL